MKVTVIPVIAKADTMTEAELDDYRQEVSMHVYSLPLSP